MCAVGALEAPAAKLTLAKFCFRGGAKSFSLGDTQPTQPREGSPLHHMTGGAEANKGNTGSIQVADSDRNVAGSSFRGVLDAASRWIHKDVLYEGKALPRFWAGVVDY